MQQPVTVLYLDLNQPLAMQQALVQPLPHKPGLGVRLPQSFTRDKTIVAVLKGRVEVLTLSEPSLSFG